MNFHFFRITRLPRIWQKLSPLERKLALSAASAVVVCGSFVAATGYYNATVGAPDYGGTYSEGLVGQPRYINPVLAPANEVDKDISRIVYSGLLKYDANQKLAPDLAAELPTLSADQKQYTVKLRPNVVWHDGAPFTADDVVFTVHTIQNASYNSPLRGNWLKVDVQKIDPLTVQFTLHEPSAPFITNLTQGIIPQHVWESIDPTKFPLAQYNLEPVGTGPFEVQNLKRSGDGTIPSIRLAANPNYWQGRPYLDQIEFKFYTSYDDLISAYHAHDILGLGYLPFDKKVYVEKSSSINLSLANLPQYQALFFNRAKSAVLGDSAVRQALAASLNRTDIIQQVYLGAAQPAYGPIPPGALGYNPAVEQAHPYDLAQAQHLLDQAGWKTPTSSPQRIKGKTPLEFTLTTDDFPVNAKTAELLRDQWQAIGFKVDVQILTTADLEQNLRTRQYESLLFSENVGADPDPYAFWHSSQRIDPGLNLAMFSNKEADQLITDARTNADPAYRAPRYQRFQDIVDADVPAVFIANSLYVYGVSTKVQGINLHAIVDESDRFEDVSHWYMNTRRTIK